MSTLIELNEEQKAAEQALHAFLSPDSNEQFFLLSGFAGTGKTFLLSRALTGKKVVFTAPTNKAVKVLNSSLLAALGSSSLRPPDSCTIHSLLGLTLKADGEVKVLKKKEVPYSIDQFEVIVVDEASMIGAELLRYLEAAVRGSKVKVIFSGDSMQLPPVKEKVSPVWNMPIPRVELTQVMRYKNAILDYATMVRGRVNAMNPKVKPVPDNDGETGVFVYPSVITAAIRSANDDFQSPDKVKIIAWRNLMVDHYNSAVRKMLFEDAERQLFLPTDRIVVTEPAMVLDSTSNISLAATDDEGTVLAVGKTERMGVECYKLEVRFDTGKVAELITPTLQGKVEVQARKDQMAREAKLTPHLWKVFWEFHESFHYMKHSYAITAHRSQGSTYEKVYVDIHDILRNRETSEAVRCLYVASTRASRELHFPGRPIIM